MHAAGPADNEGMPSTLQADAPQTRSETAVREAFRNERYLEINARRLEHLASLGLDLTRRSVLELGAGIGDLTGFFTARNCTVDCTEGRDENLALLRQRFAGRSDVRIHRFDLDPPTPPDAIVNRRFDVVFCYGLLYHLSNPGAALDAIAPLCAGTLLLSTCVSRGENESIQPTPEPAHSPSQAMTGAGCRPTRPWVWNALRARFEHVYSVRTQPAHPEFPIDWTDAGRASDADLTRCVFVASRTPIANDLLVPELLARQRRQG